MRFFLLFAIVLAALYAAPCEISKKGHPTSSLEEEASSAVTFREHCEAFESLDFGTKTATGLHGHVWLGADIEPKPLEGVQIAAREVTSEALHYVVTKSDGQFQVDSLSSGEYDVWTCLDGFDQARFRLIVDPNSSLERVNIYLSPSEAAGRRAVVLEEEIPPKNE